MVAEETASVVLIGLESVGKSALFRGLTGSESGDERNFRGSTVTCRTCHVEECECDLVDTPGIRIEADSVTTSLTLARLGSTDTVLLVVRAPYLLEEARTLFEALRLGARRIAIAVTFADKVSSHLAEAVEKLRARLRVPVVALNARELSRDDRHRLLDAIRLSTPAQVDSIETSLVQLRARAPRRTLFEHALVGPWLALFSMLVLLALPVALAFEVASRLQPFVDAVAIVPLTRVLAGTGPWLHAVLVGPYGLLTLGSYSFVWAFPVVVLLGVTSSLAEESGLHDRVMTALDPWLRHVGLTGRDLGPVLTGFGCNVVAVLHSRACSACSRKACVSLIGFGSACSYQIGASLSLFGSAGRPWLFTPYLLAVFLVGLVHTRIWHGALARGDVQPLHERAYLQFPALRAVRWRVGILLKQFLWQAMPIFLALCIASALLDRTGALSIISEQLEPCMRFFALPKATALAVFVSIPRKDGMLLLNANDGGLLHALSAGQLFVVVYLASTLTPCLVTLATVGRELGFRNAVAVTGRQALTSLASAWIFSQALT